MARPKHERTPKALLEPVIRELKMEYDMGDACIGMLLGYSDAYIRNLRNDFGIPPHGDRFAFRERILSTLTADLTAKIRSIHARNRVYWNNCKGTKHYAPKSVHTLVDAWAEESEDSGGNVRPEKAVA